MDYVQIISSVGFPIFMCIVLMKYVNDSETKNREVINDLRDTIQENTNVLAKIFEDLHK